MSQYPRHHAFTLLELSVVLAIIALVVVSGLNVGSGALKATDRVRTQERLATVQQALESYVRANGYLPCPANRALMPSGNAAASDDAAFGMEQRSGTSCSSSAPGSVTITVSGKTAYIGGVPVRTLGLPDAYAADSWNNKFTYAVSGPQVAGPSSYASSDGVLNVFYGDRNGTNYAITSTTDRSVAPPTITPGPGATYIVISHGADGRGAFPMDGTSVPTTAVCIPAGSSPPPCETAANNMTCNDIENCNDNNLVFYDTKFNDNIESNEGLAGTGHWFDDYVVWGSNATMRTPITTTATGCTGACESACAICSKNFPSATAIGTAAPNGLSNPVLCQKVITSTAPCQATCFWGGTQSGAPYSYQACP